MTTIENDSFTKIYYDLIRTVASEGELEGKTRDLPAVHLELTDPTQGLLFLNKNWIWCFQEAFDRMSGIFGNPRIHRNPGLAYHLRPAWKRKLEKEGGEFHYAYGDCYVDQIPHLVKQLKKQKTSREAIITMWDSNYLVFQKDYNRRPCTLTLHFLIRDKKLNLFVNMRTNDIINLLPFDVFHHTLLQQYVANVLDLKLGTYYHFASHMYYPKKREREGRNFLEKVFKKLENNIERLDEFKIPKLKSSNIEEDWKYANIMVYRENTPYPLRSKLLGDMVKFIKGKPVSGALQLVQEK